MDLSNLKRDLETNNVECYLEFISNHHSEYKNDLDKYSELMETVLVTLKTILDGNFLKSHSELVEKCLNFLRFSCAQGNDFQERVVDKSGIVEHFSDILTVESPSITKLLWQLLCNSIVMCPKNAKIIHEKLFETIKENLNSNPNLDVIAGIAYNMLKLAQEKDNEINIDMKSLFETVLKAKFNDENSESSFVELILEYFLVETPEIAKIYCSLETDDKIKANHYIAEFVKHQNTKIGLLLLNGLAEEFTKLSDRILTRMKNIGELKDPRELMSILECLTVITSTEMYIGIYRSYTSMFINCGGLLVASMDPKMEQFRAKSSLSDFSFDPEKQLETQQDPFYDFKTFLVRLIANLSFKNKKNQDIARDIQVVTAVCSCTGMDARNPLMKEWAILAIRNLLENNLENQKLIQSMTQQGQASNSELKEFQMENGVMRLNKN